MNQLCQQNTFKIRGNCNILQSSGFLVMQTGDTDHDCHKIKIEHDIVDKAVETVHNLLVRLK